MHAPSEHAVPSGAGEVRTPSTGSHVVTMHGDAGGSTMGAPLHWPRPLHVAIVHAESEQFVPDGAGV